MKVENEDFEPETVQEQEDEINENERQGRDYNALINSAKLIQEYIIESEMYGELDKQDPFYTCYKSLEDLIEKFQDEKLENKN